MNMVSADYEGDNDDIIEKFFYQVVTRAREQLCIIVLNNEDIFKQLLYLLGRIHENNKSQE